MTQNDRPSWGERGPQTEAEYNDDEAHRDDGQCHDACWERAVAEGEAAAPGFTAPGLPHRGSGVTAPGFGIVPEGESIGTVAGYEPVEREVTPTSLAEANKLFDDLATEVYYGFNFRCTLAESTDEELRMIRALIERAREGTDRA